MVVVRPTQKVLGKIGQPPSTAAHASTTALGDWYVNLLFTQMHITPRLSGGGRLLFPAPTEPTSNDARPPAAEGGS